MFSILNEIIQWACTYLSSHHYKLQHDLPEIVKDTPWSCVMRFATSNGDIYLKHTPKLIALEANIIQILQDQFHAPVPEIIAHNTELNCFMMKDAGISLRSILKKQFNGILFAQAIDQFTSLQLAVADHVNVLLNAGVPDWRLDKLSDLYKELLAQKEVLIAEGLTELEINELMELAPKISQLCKKLSEYSIKQTMVQPDFHDNNVLINEESKKMTIIDLGEIVISHPFFSLINCMHQLTRHHGFTEKDAAYQRLKDACLKNFMVYETKENLLAAFTEAEPLLLVYGILAHYRLMLACDKQKLIAFQGQNKFAEQLRELMKVCG